MKRLFLLIILLYVFQVTGISQMRFPKPEFSSGYQIPVLSLEKSVNDFSSLRIGLLVLLLIICWFAVYKLRSRRIILLVTALNLLIFGFIMLGCICPVGLIQNISAAAFSRDEPFTLLYAILFAVPLLTAMFFGRLFCTAGCPFGAVQELIHFKTVRVPFALDRFLRFFPYVILGLAIVFAASGIGFIVCRFDPFVVIFRRTGTWYMIGAAAFFLLLGIFISRPYCRYFCPYGVLLRFTAMLTNKKVTVSPDYCVNCRLCEKSCPNDAIIPAASKKNKENYSLGKKRIALLVSLIPIFAVIGSLFFYSLSDYISMLHHDVSLYHELKNPQPETSSLAVQTFLSSGKPSESSENLIFRYTRAVNIIRYGLLISGAVIMILICIDLILLARKRTNSEPIVDASLCYTCGRCYESCPVGQKFLQKKNRKFLKEDEDK